MQTTEQQDNIKNYWCTVFTHLTPVPLIQWSHYELDEQPETSAQNALLHGIILLKIWYWICHYNGQLYFTNDMVQWTICLGNEGTADIRSAVRGTHTCMHVRTHTRTDRLPLSAPQDWKPSFCVCFSVQCTNKWNQSLGELFVCLRGLCPCCDIIYECHNWGSVNCRFSPLSDAPCVNTEVQGDRADQYAETGAIPWIYCPSNKRAMKQQCCSLQPAARRGCSAAGLHLSNTHSSDSPRNFVLFLLF